MKKFFNIIPAICIGILILSACVRPSDSNDNVSMVIGTYTDTGSHGIYSYSFDQQIGKFRVLDSLKAVNPSYLIFSQTGQNIYAANEVEDSQAGVSSISFDKTTGGMTLLNGEPTGVGSPCYLATNGKIVVTANYSGGSVSVFPIDSTGKLKPASQTFYGGMGGPDSTRQEAPHVHCVIFTPEGKYLLASDFSADRILFYEVFNEGDSIQPAMDENGEQKFVKVNPDSGPRHMIFDKSGRHAYVIGELSGDVTVFDYDNGNLTVRQVVEGDPYKGRGSADIHLSPDGRFLYTTNRLKGDGIATFAVDQSTGELTPKAYQLTGPHPRNFNITPNGKYLLVACRDNNTIEVFQRNEETGILIRTDTKISVPKPVCIQFEPEN